MRRFLSSSMLHGALGAGLLLIGAAAQAQSPRPLDESKRVSITVVGAQGLSAIRPLAADPTIVREEATGDGADAPPARKIRVIVPSPYTR